MRIICTECDHANELGHVFCVECGARLDLKNATDKIDSANKSEKQKAVWKIAWIFPVLILLVLSALGFWPAKGFYDPKKKSGDAAHCNRVIERSYKMTRMTDATLRPELNTVDINAWMQRDFGVLGVDTVSIKTGDDKVTLRVTDRTRSKTIGGRVHVKSFPYSYSVTCGVSSNGLKVSSATIGHLPLFGPAAKPVVTMVEKLVDRRNREKTIYKHLIDMTTTPDIFIYELKTETAKERHDRLMMERKAAAMEAQAEREAQKKAVQGN